jgi:hypothetical protein
VVTVVRVVLLAVVVVELVGVVVGVVLVHACTFASLCQVPYGQGSHTRSLVDVFSTATNSPGEHAVTGVHSRSEVTVGDALS